MKNKIPTKERILLVAEKLFAQEGIEAVSMRRISADSGQRNNSALQYHYGGKEELLKAIVAYRMIPINQRHTAMLRELEQRAATRDLRELIGVLVYPFAEHVDTLREGSYYISFLARYLLYTGNGLFFGALDKPWLEATQRVSKHMLAALTHLPDKICLERLTFVGAQLVHAVAQREYQIRTHNISYLSDMDSFASNLVDCLHGSMVAPVSEETKMVLSQCEPDTV